MIRGGILGPPGQLDDPRPHRSVTSTLVFLAGLAALGVLLSLVRSQIEPPRVGGDVFWYVRYAFQLAGLSEALATRETAEFMVAAGQSADPARLITFVETIDPRYPAIFASRPFYPLTFAPLIRILEPQAAMHVSIVTAAALFAAITGWFVRLVSGSLPIAVGVVALAFALPSGGWFAHFYAEGWMLALWSAGLAFAGLFLARGAGGHLGAAVAGLILLYLTKPANGAVLALTLALVGFVGASLPRLEPRRRYLVLAASATAVALTHLIALRVLGLPGLTESLQDTFTAHFTQPDVADPYGSLVRRNLQLLPAMVTWVTHDPLTPAVMLGLAALGLIRRGWAVLWLVGGLATGLTVLLHPVTTQFERLMAPTWLSAALGIGVAAAAGASAFSRRRRAPA